MNRFAAIAGVCIAFAGMAFAHANVSDARVKAWMNNMKAISAETKILGQMARKQQTFDSARANAALERLADHAEQVPALFRERADDPVSEARTEIWSNWDHYVR